MDGEIFGWVVIGRVGKDFGKDFRGLGWGSGLGCVGLLGLMRLDKGLFLNIGDWGI